MKNGKISGIILFMVLFMVQCVSKEDEMIPVDDEAVEMPEFPLIEDPDPVIEEPRHEELFTANLSLDVLKEEGVISAEDETTPSPMAIFEALVANAKDIDPGLKPLLKTVNVAFLMEILDPEKSLDPKLEGLLKKMMALEGQELSLPVLPEIRPQPLTEEEGSEGIDEGGITIALEQLEGDFESSCVEEVREEYGSGVRGCSLDYDRNIQEIESNYLRRVSEAEERFLQRNELIGQLYSEKFILMGMLLKEISKKINSMDHLENSEALRLKLSYFGLIYAYYIRINLPLLYNYGLAVNQSLYDKEINTIIALRDKKSEEASKILAACMAWVNQLIAEEIERRCS